MPEPPLNEADTRAKLIDPALHKRGWPETGDWIHREQTPGPFLRIGSDYVRGGRRSDYLLQIRVQGIMQPIAVVEAKPEGSPPDEGGEQAKRDAHPDHRLSCPHGRLRAPLVRHLPRR